MGKKNFKSIGMRYPLDLHAKLVKMAKAEGRSLHAQILYLLRQAVERGDKERLS
jgi:hypothetical protein